MRYRAIDFAKAVDIGAEVFRYKLHLYFCCDAYHRLQTYRHNRHNRHNRHARHSAHEKIVGYF